VMWRGLGTELRYGLRHRCLAKAAGNCYSPDLRPPYQDPTLPKDPHDATLLRRVCLSKTLKRRRRKHTTPMAPVSDFLRLDNRVPVL
jgi:hypothetical protein